MAALFAKLWANSTSAERPAKRVRMVEPERDLDVQEDGGTFRCKSTLEIRGDSENAVGWLNGTRTCCADVTTSTFISMAQQHLFSLWSSGQMEPANLGTPWAYHVVRERNHAPDALCNRVMDTQENIDRTFIALEINELSVPRF